MPPREGDKAELTEPEPIRALVDRKLHETDREHTRTSFLMVRVSRYERDVVNSLAQRIGLSVSELIRHLLMRTMYGPNGEEVQAELIKAALESEGVAFDPDLRKRNGMIGMEAYEASKKYHERKALRGQAEAEREARRERSGPLAKVSDTGDAEPSDDAE